jgi:LysM repeat protein
MFAKLLGFLVLTALVAAIVVRGSAGGEPEHAYVVQPGDTLWSIAAAHYSGDPRDAIWRLERRNHVSGALIRPGQRLVLP